MTDGDGSGDTSGTVCPYCAVGCRLARTGGSVSGRRGPANVDGRLCEKGLRAFDPVDHEDRLTSPLVREGEGLVATSWEVALDRVVDSIERVVEAYGHDGLAFLGAPRCTNEENYLLQKLARTLGTNNVDNRARLCHADTTAALADRLGWPATTNTLADLGRADVVLAVGADPAERQPIAFDSHVRPAVAEGTTLVHVDPRRNETTRLAQRHVAPIPGTDALVFSLVCALLVDRDCADEAFVRERTSGFAGFRTWLDGLDPSADAARADVEPDELRALAETLSDADRVAVLTGTGADDPATADALVNLLLLTGNVGRPGTGLHVLRGLNNEQGATDVGCVPHRLPGHEPVGDPAARERVAAEWGVEPPATPGSTEPELLSAFGDGVYGAVVVGENPAVEKRDAEWVDRRLDALDALIVTELFPTETTRHADVVLPAAAGVEKAGTVTNLDRQIQRLEPAASPPGEARPDFEILRAIGASVRPSGFDFETPAAAFEELCRVAPPYAGTSYGALGERSRRWPVTGSGPDGSSDGILYRRAFATADGRAPFVAVDLPDDERGEQSGRYHLVISDRVGEFTAEPGSDRDRRVTVHPDDASTHSLADGDHVVVSNEGASITLPARVSASVRRGTVHVEARAGDPLVRADGRRVVLEPVSTANPDDQ